MESVHEGKTFPCNSCESVCSSRGSLVSHKAYKHRNGKNECNLCNQLFSSSNVLKIHMKSFHEGIKKVLEF